ncbi:hypothetical protein FJ251_06705 [bacterium]|nr:hypothetical protein [bacterium]
MKRARGGALLVASSVLWLPAQSLAAVVRVPADAQSIHAGVAAAQAGDTVLIAPGTYYEHDIELKDGITVLGEGRNEPAVTIDAVGLGRIMNAHNPTVKPMHAHIEGITFRNGFASTGGGIAASGSDFGFELEIVSCAFVANIAQRGGGLYVQAGNGSLIDCRFDGNTAVHGGGLACADACMTNVKAVSALRCEFVGNAATMAGGAVDVGMHSLHMTDCILEDNQAQMGGAVHSSNYNSAGCRLQGCVFARNIATEGGAFHSMEDVLFIANCLFTENRAKVGGAAWISYPRDAVIRSCTFARNAAPKASGICFSEVPLLSLEQSILADGADGNAIACIWNGELLELTCCDVYGNEGGDWVGCIADQLGVSGNISLDPRFCLGQNPSSPYSLQAGSPCAEGNDGECGQIGALGVGCEDTSIVQTSISAIKVLY